MAAIARQRPFYVDLGGSLRDPSGSDAPRPLQSRVAGFYYRHAERKMAESARLLISVSPYLFQTFPPSGAPKVVVSHSMIREMDIYVRHDACAKGVRLVFSAARLIESKGIQYLVRAVARLGKQSNPVILKIAGTGDYLPARQKLAVDLGLLES